MRRKFTSYKSFAEASITDIFSAADLQASQHLRATCLSTTIFENRDGHFYPRSIPLQAQFSPVYSISVTDLDHDGKPDIILLGNNDYPRLKLGKMDANFGTVLMNDGKGNFKYAGFNETGLFAAGDTKHSEFITIHGEKYFLIGINNSDIIAYKMKR
jgi:hypothetical protein